MQRLYYGQLINGITSGVHLSDFYNGYKSRNSLNDAVRNRLQRNTEEKSADKLRCSIRYFRKNALKLL